MTNMKENTTDSWSYRENKKLGTYLGHEFRSCLHIYLFSEKGKSEKLSRPVNKYHT